MRPESHILFMMSGSIACAKATGLISAWRKAGHRVRVATTASVANFVGRATLEGLSGEPLFEDTFEAGRAMDHITLAQWADVVVVCPASANLLARFAQGIADDAVTTLWQATWARRAPQFIVPAMNSHMWSYPATQANVERLRQWGVHVLPTDRGELACGEQGAGRMLEPDVIQRHVEAVLREDTDRRSADVSRPESEDRDAGPAEDGGASRRRVLITGGGTREPIDAVRYIGNTSTGRTSARLAEALRARGFQVTWLGGAGAMEPEGGGIRRERFVSFEDLEQSLQTLLGASDFDAVVHAAAVSDFSVAERPGSADGKLSSGAGFELRLEPNPKLLDSLRAWSRNPDIDVIGFKLTVGAGEDERWAAVRRQFAAGQSDWVVHNDADELSDAAHPFTLYSPSGAKERVEGPGALAEALANRLLARQEEPS
ncbi:MAG: phosphopantothenoylcysteine decarboxylase [Xanthomonadales bacterium]|jgi:phosphopantothenoylcysteine decarboxylase/phosphopantothenate--cysteine ligase|nr:phosphopantothenoylcysteine decarboxylase [Xanthomonadales bacterium]